MKKKSIVLALCLLLAATLWAQQSSSYTRSQVVATGFVPYAGTLVSLGTYGFLPAEYQTYYLGGMSLLGNIPALQVNTRPALTETALEAGILAAGFALSDYPMISDPLFNIGWKASWWTQYEAYSTVRSNCNDYTNPQQVTFTQAFSAPFNPQVLKRNEVWIPLLVGSALTVGGSLGNTEHAVWNTGRAYLGNTQVPVAVGIGATALLTGLSMTFTAIGEEAMFRGIGYEEMKSSCGKLPATMVDVVLFSAVHIPQEIVSGMDSGTVIGNFIVRAGIAGVLEWIYNRGGLESAIAFHMWFNTISMMSQYVCSGGQNTDVASASIGRNTTMNIGYTTSGVRLDFCCRY